MLEKSNTAKFFASIGIISGFIYASNKNKPPIQILLFGLGFGAAGFVLGNALQNLSK